MAEKRIECCPHCGSDEGICTKTTYVNVPYRMGFDGVAQDNSEMYDNTESFRGGETAYCQSCNKVVCRMKRLEKQWGEGIFRLGE